MAEIYRADHVGSLLRPESLKEARSAFEAGSLSADRLRELEDAAILEAIAQQERIGVAVYTDGEFRRAGFQNDMQDSVAGFIDTGTPAVVRIWKGPGGEPQAQGTRQVVGAKLSPRRRLTGSQTEYLKANAPGPVKMTVPSPNQFPAICYQEGVTDRFYPTRSDLLQELTGIIKDEIQALLADGVSYIQMDEPRYSHYVDPTWRDHLRGLGEDPDKAFEEAMAADNACLADARRAGVTVAIHICRGNNQSKWYAEGGYEPIAEKLFNGLDVDRFLLEYDTDRAGTFDPLRFIPKDKVVVLGLLSSKEGALEDQDELLRRIDEAAKFFPLENMALSPQCGFASMAAGNLLTEDQQWRKLELVVDTARKVWG
jgi:5-methyltetrahydropteroyltriglutamate--homocysteine methyltransferase